MMGIFGRHDSEETRGGMTWWISSKADPRWNASGRCFPSMWSAHDECRKAVGARTVQYGEPPADLEFGGMKD
jgi:hypothetical protein